jgi:hypothetical protein
LRPAPGAEVSVHYTMRLVQQSVSGDLQHELFCG